MRKEDRLALSLYDVGAIQFGQFRLKLHDRYPHAPLSPFYIDLRRIRSFPRVMRQTVEVYEGLLEGKRFDLLADVPTAATPIVAILSFQLKIPMVSPRMDRKTHGAGARIEGVFKEGQEVVLVDDLITRAESKLEAIAILEEGGLKVRHVVVLIDREQGGREELEKAGYQLWSAFEISHLFEEYLRSGRLDERQYQEVVDYLHKAM